MKRAVALALLLMSAGAGADDPSAPTAARSVAWDVAQSTVDAKSLRQFHDLLASEPHVAGTSGDAREIRRIELAFRGMGLETEVFEFWPLLAVPVSARVELVGADAAPLGAAPAARRGVLPVIERNLAEDPAAAHPDLNWGWCAYGGSGDVEGEIVYANYGRAEDFAQLKAWGVDVTGRIVLARYGGNFRGFKERFAREAGAVGLLIYIDPADSGFTKGAIYPDGPWANDSCIQRGSMLSLGYPGDPLTPGWAAMKDARRLELTEVALPTLPVQPIGYAAAGQIMARMTGDPVSDASWRGGMQMEYRAIGGAQSRVRMQVQQRREIRRTANVIARLRGSTGDGTTLIIGCHHDAWGFGAADPLAGTMVLMECARAFAAAAAAGERPGCDILFCAWGAEEFGIIGSTEWVEANAPLLEKARAYINLDMASMGMNLGVSASPSIRGAVAAACGIDPSKVASPGGGSDHVGFLFHAGVPCVGIGAGGAPGTAYHSNYDTTAWYRKSVGDDYASAVLVSKATIAVAATLAQAGGVPQSGAEVVRTIREACERMRTEAAAATDPLAAARSEAATRVIECFVGCDRADGVDRLLLAADGLPGRPWFRNLLIATNPDNSYQCGDLPGLRWARSKAELDLAVEQLCAAATRMAGNAPSQGGEPSNAQ
jgi:N-acetylated-alpha-linked acidic dipeptidase